MDAYGQLQILAEVALAGLLGGLIGVERELADKPAGLRTNMLLAGASALLVGLSKAFLLSFAQAEYQAVIRLDPTRTVQAIITGISFLGAGTIIRRTSTERVEGLTTAASLLASGGVGIAVALEQFYLAIGVTLLALLVLSFVRYLEGWIVRNRKRFKS